MSSARPVSWLSWYLWLVGVVALLAFAAALMPASWIVSITDRLHLQPFPPNPVAFYLARHLSLLYGFVGVALVFLSFRVDRYRELVGHLAIGVIVFGVLQGVIDLQSGMPMSWTAGESASTVFGGFLLFWLDRVCQSPTDSR
ncbi:hypothetical protein NHH03_26725 [Stieleria sp. TO1_6]|uniref:hypothetical protein n=1 Tax=Stieleria tagensis TaxID=2956795 RepID=UPI00209B245D|nr:hypothetical protein [Stieleria tagensis]MCO8125362.1 hypothetical protein [Stieleria tagensis]